ncbi:zwei Ig domain protein zig-8-like [Oratosquilla oratoria]|uniref:zwei Ig domain protein zig-8-like n=1 Tax=Oratosquilla oratoria TaxID=337810 RepID=UPI003F76328E
MRNSKLRKSEDFDQRRGLRPTSPTSTNIPNSHSTPKNDYSRAVLCTPPTAEPRGLADRWFNGYNGFNGRPAQQFRAHQTTLRFSHSKKLESSSQLWWSEREVLLPRFEDTPSNVTTFVGDSAFLPCTVGHLGDRSVTWMRQRDLHILTAGILTYSADERFRVLHPDNSDDWTLEIKFATARDAGVYECQVNSDPKISRPVVLNVKERNQLDDPSSFGMAVWTTDARMPDYIFEDQRKMEKAPKKGRKGRRKGRRKMVPLVHVEGGAERYIQRGSVLAITCIVHHTKPTAPDHVTWHHEGQIIDYDSPRGGVSIQTEKAARRTVSKLMLAAVTQKDSGTYSCMPTDLDPATVVVHVQNGDHQAAVQQGGLTSRASSGLPMQYCIIITIVLFLSHIFSTTSTLGAAMSI